MTSRAAATCGWFRAGPAPVLTALNRTGLAAITGNGFFGNARQRSATYLTFRLVILS